MFLHQREDCVNLFKKGETKEKKGLKGGKVTRYTSPLA